MEKIFKTALGVVIPLISNDKYDIYLERLNNNRWYLYTHESGYLEKMIQTYYRGSMKFNDLSNKAKQGAIKTIFKA